jgi:hypothetical protein
LQQHYRKIVETSASLVERLLPKHIHATNAAGFELKVILFVFALLLTASYQWRLEFVNLADCGRRNQPQSKSDFTCVPN